MEIPVSTTIGPGLTINHGYGLVINADSTIGSFVKLRHGVTIGNRGDGRGCPTIGNGVDFGVGASVLGEVCVGDGARIGSGAVVLADVPSGVRVPPNSVWR